jgi:hypothetical protein
MQNTVTIEKQSTGSLRWYVISEGRMLVRCETKKLARLYQQLFQGDLGVAQEWYRLILKYARRRMSEGDALRYACGAAEYYGLRPSHVRADPETGEPLDGQLFSSED